MERTKSEFGRIRETELVVVAAEFVAGAIALDIGSVAEINLVLVLAAVARSLVAAGSTRLERLVHRSEGGTDVFQFVIDVSRNFGETNHQSQNSDRGDQDQFARNNETVFVVVELSEGVVHGVDSCVTIPCGVVGC